MNPVLNLAHTKIPEDQGHKKAAISSLAQLITFALSILSILFILKLDVGFISKVIFILLIAIFLGFFYARFVTSYEKEKRITSANLKNAKNKMYYIGGGEFAGRGDGNYYVISSLEAPCIYPHCNGRILVTGTPLREQGKYRDFVGICSVADKDHSYKVDYNMVATPVKFDWRELDENSN